MCGIVGFLGFRGLTNGTASTVALEMADRIAHRGPDDSGAWVDEATEIALGHRRLSIVDLSPAGHQPMMSPAGRYVITFNGEIYNHLELRQRLAAYGEQPAAFRGHSDTETLLACCDAWGVERTLRGTVGMFAFALWDRAERRLFLGRDRMGEKPLYYGWQNGVLLFGSELKAFKAHPEFQGTIARDAIALQLRHSCVPAPYSIYVGIQKLPPGTYLEVSANDAGKLARPKPYWSLLDVVVNGARDPFQGDEVEAAQTLEAFLRDAVSRQMIADVPVGASLSGGIDSSTIVALMQGQSARKVNTFTIGFHEAAFNEAGHAKAVAGHLGTHHTELYVSAQDALDVIPLLPRLYDEPFSDTSQIPTFLVSKLARQHVTVSLSGDAGDELFGGYLRHLWARRIWEVLKFLPIAARNVGARGVRSVSIDQWNRLAAPIITLLNVSVRNFGERAQKLGEIMAARTPEAFYRGLVSHWSNPEEIVLDSTEPGTALTDSSSWLDLAGFEQQLMYLDAVTYLPDDILVKADRAAMGVALETRMPMLDHRVVELASRLPLPMKIREGQGKRMLRQILQKYVPRNLIERPKMGFTVPIGDWLRGPLREWASHLLEESRLRQEGYFNPKPIRDKWEEHLSGRHNWQQHLWDVLMFQSWLEHERSQ